MSRAKTKKKLPVVPANPPAAAELGRYNASELVQMAYDLGQFDLHRGMPKEELVARILDPLPSTTYRPVDRNRIGIMRYVNDHYEQVRPLVASCPASYRTPTACFSCSDVQVTHCWELNKSTLRTVNEEEVERVMAEQQNTEFRSRAEWTAISQSTDNTERALIAKALMGMGFKASELSGMSAEARVEKLMELQAARGYVEDGKKPAKQPAGSKATAAKPAATSAAPKPAAAPSAAGGSPGNAEILGRLSDLQDRVDALAAENSELKDYVIEAHAMMRTMFVMGGMDEALLAEFKGQLMGGND